NYICHLAVYRTALVRALGGLDAGFDGAQDWDLALRVTAQLSTAEIHHVPTILYHWRAWTGSTAAASETKSYAIEAGRRAIERRARSDNPRATVEHLSSRYY